MAAARITLLSRPGCHLCDDARVVIERVAADLEVGWEERDITASPDDLTEYWDKIPVTFVDGVQVDFWRISEPRLRAALTGHSDVPRLHPVSGRGSGRQAAPHGRSAPPVCGRFRETYMIWVRSSARRGARP